MACKECGNKLDKDIAFCGMCGTKVELEEKIVNLTEDICAQCGKDISKGAKFCRHCGSTVEARSPQEETVEERTGQEVAVSLEETGKLVLEKNKSIKDKGKIVKIIVAGLVLILLGIGFSSRIKPAVKGIPNLIMFEQDNDIYGKYNGKEKYLLKGDYVEQFLVSRDGKKIYSLDDENLYLQEGKGNSQKIASDVQWFGISPLGDTVAFIKDMDGYRGDLYVKWGNNSPEKIASEDCHYMSVSISENGKYVAFSETEDDYSFDDPKNYLYRLGSQKEAAGRGIPIMVDNKGTILGVTSEETLYITQKGKSSEKLLSDFSSVLLNKDFSKILVGDMEDNLYLYKGNDKEKIDSNIDHIIAAKGLKNIKSFSYDIWQTNTNALDMIYYKNGSTYSIFDGKKLEKLVGDLIGQLSYSDHFRDFSYINNNSLYIKRFSGNKLSVDEKITSNVTYAYMDGTGKHTVYIKNRDLYYLSKGKKEGKKIVSDVVEVQLQKDGTIYYKDIDDALFISKGAKPGKKILDDVYKWGTNEGGTTYILDKDQVFYEQTGNGKPKKVADDVSNMTIYKEVYDFYMD